MSTGEGTEIYYEESYDFFPPFFEGTGENMNQIMESAIGQGGARSMRGYQEVKFGRRWRTKVVAEVY